MLNLFRSPPLNPRILAFPTTVFALPVNPNCSINPCTTSSLALRPNFFPSLNSTLKSKVSLTVMCGKKVTSCSMNAEGSWESPATGSSLTYLEPCRRTLEESLIRPARAWTRVDFPEPDGPIMASILPGRAFPRMDPSNMIRSSFFFFFCFNVMRMSEKPISTFLRNPRSMRASSSMTISSSSSSSSSCAPNFTTSLRGCDD
mmetsp:Transcript_23135/g.68250  ORF Transcript_23135/g.68250 Transcript_23135/m.68250 type:complete len:202 (-) Transcript_23135:824-1429(-)